jgi:hypothetical protein
VANGDQVALQSIMDELGVKIQQMMDEMEAARTQAAEHPQLPNNQSALQDKYKKLSTQWGQANRAMQQLPQPTANTAPAQPVANTASAQPVAGTAPAQPVANTAPTQQFTQQTGNPGLGVKYNNRRQRLPQAA